MPSLSRGRVERRCHFTFSPNAKINTAIFSQLFLFHVRSGPKTETYLIPFAEKEEVGQGREGYCVCAIVELFTSEYKSLKVSLQEYVPPSKGLGRQMD